MRFNKNINLLLKIKFYNKLSKTNLNKSNSHQNKLNKNKNKK